MESKKWIMRQKDPLDGRSVRIFLTTLGKQKREISRRSVKAFNQHILEKTNSDQLKIFFQVMNVINDVATDKEKIQSFLVEINDQAQCKRMNNKQAMGLIIFTPFQKDFIKDKSFDAIVKGRS